MGQEARSSRGLKDGLPPLQLSQSLRGLEDASSPTSPANTITDEPRRLMRAPCIGAAPALPGVDAHISRAELKYGSLSEQVRRQRWHVREDDGDDSPASVGGTAPKVDDATRKALRRVVRYIDVEFGNGDGEISQVELEHAFRRVRRERAAAAVRERGRALIRRCRVLMTRRNLDVEGLMRFLDASQGGHGDGSITMVELRQGLKRLLDSEGQLVGDRAMVLTGAGEAVNNHRHSLRARDRDDVVAMRAAEQAQAASPSLGEANPAAHANLRGELKFSEQDLMDLHRFLDPDADANVSLLELRVGLERTAEDESTSSLADEAAIVMARLEDEMKGKGQRVVDLFRALDVDNSGRVTTLELESMLEQMAGPSHVERAHQKREALLQRKAEAAERTKEKEGKELLERRAKAEAAGATRALGRLNLLLKRKGNLRVSDLVSKAGFDASGDGLLDGDELRQALLAAGLNLDAADVALLIAYVDVDGDGNLDAAELDTALRRHRRDHKDDPETDDAPTPVPQDPRARKHRRFVADDALGREFDGSWLKSLDSFLSRHTGPQKHKYASRDGEKRETQLPRASNGVRRN
ncbi:hypothetical protein M885DRAFT_534945 [Pelagophyceae sp. CCMP2097]|nr:hypothetical protein M885DRAFT_534945 [Pelagophyceae sp. CCMP2097]